MKERKHIHSTEQNNVDLSFMTLNVACLPIMFGKQINAHYLEHNNNRVNNILNLIQKIEPKENKHNNNNNNNSEHKTSNVDETKIVNNETKNSQQDNSRTDLFAATPLKKSPDIISFQELFDYRNVIQMAEGLKARGYRYIATSMGVFDLDIQSSTDILKSNILMTSLTSYFPLASSLLSDNSSCLMNPGGLLIASKKPILASQFVKFDNAMLGEEIIAKKGVLMAKIDIGENKFITYANTHLHAGGALFKNLSSLRGTTSDRRGEQMGAMHDALLSYQDSSIKHYSGYEHAKTIISGDFNVSFNHDRHYKSISSGSSGTNGFRKNERKYYGQALLFQNFSWQRPENFCNVRTKDDTSDAENRKDNKKLIVEANQNGCYTGTSISEQILKQYKNDPNTSLETQHKVIDILNPSDYGYKTKYHSHIHSFGTETDHLSLIGEATIDLNSAYTKIRHPERYRQGFFESSHKDAICLSVLGGVALSIAIAGLAASASVSLVVLGVALLIAAYMLMTDRKINHINLTK